MTVLLVKSGGAAALPEWQEHFAVAAPDLRVLGWDDPSVAPEEVRYVFPWAPEPGRLASLPNLRLIVSPGAGVDHITKDPAWPAHLPLVRMGGEEPGQRMGEYVALACLSLLREWRRVSLSQAAAKWEDHQSGRCAPEVTVGVMGLGNLGARSATMLTGLGFRVVGWSRSRKDVPGVECFAGDGERDTFLARSDILVCLLPDTPDTRGAIRAETIAKLPPGAAVVNAARGPHVVLDDLLAALDAGRLSGAVLDVFDEEPLPPSHPVWAHPKVTVSPHLASMASRAARARYVADAIRRFEAGEALANLYDPVRGY